MTVELGCLAHVDPRDVWSHEAHDFTPWLLDNADALGIDLELSGAEHPVGGFALDLIGRDLTNNCVLIVENQLSATDHGHLGQLLTYAAGTDAPHHRVAGSEFPRGTPPGAGLPQQLAGENCFARRSVVGDDRLPGELLEKQLRLLTLFIVEGGSVTSPKEASTSGMSVFSPTHDGDVMAVSLGRGRETRQCRGSAALPRED